MQAIHLSGATSHGSAGSVIVNCGNGFDLHELVFVAGDGNTRRRTGGFVLAKRVLPA